VRYFYLFLGVFASVLVVAALVWAEPAQREEVLPTFIGAALANLAIYFALNWARKQRLKRDSARDLM
jgi:hypothetical protein